jgi:hypothetical protein
MQLLEVTELAGVRSAVIMMKHRESPVRFLLFPMVHIGESQFYEAVAARLRSCRLVVVEGVGGSPRVSLLTLSYRWVRHSRRHDLIVDDIDYAGLGVPIVRPDLEGAEFDRGWSELPRRSRLLVGLLIPVVALYMLVFSDRSFLARHLELDYEPSEDEPRTPEAFEAVHRLLLDRRDKLLMRELVSIHERHGTEPIEVAVVWGAEHMRAVIRGLKALGYQPYGTDWLTVFRF